MRDEKAERARVIEVARSWLRTPYVHEAHLKGVGCDCTFIADVFEEAGLITKGDYGHYSPQWHLHLRDERYMRGVMEHAHEIKGPPKPGDVVMYRLGRVMAHAGIVVDPGWPMIIHSCAKAKMVTLGYGDQGYLAHPKRLYFSVWDS
jgi:cell wall-associated NlpC family hydrolase